MTKIERKFVHKPWGAEDWLFKTDHYVAKHLYINPHEEISLQYHHEKEETMMVLSGMGILTLSDSQSTITEGDIIHIPPRTIHQIKALTPLKLLEVSTPQTEDLVRVTDKYGRDSQ